MHPNLNRGIHIQTTNNEAETFFWSSHQESKLILSFQVFMAWTVQIVIFRVVTTYTVVHGYQHLQGQSELGEEHGQVKPWHTRKVVYQFHKTRKREHNTVQINTKVNRKCEESRNNMVLFMVKISKQNDMKRMGQCTAIKWWHLTARVHGITTDDPSHGLTQMNFG